MNIKELAKLAEVSTSTISRVVNNSGYVKKEVREKVEKLIEETGYRPNAHAKALLQNKSHTIGVILPKVNSSSSGDTVAGIDEFFSSYGYSLIIGNSNHNIEKEKSELTFENKEKDEKKLKTLNIMLNLLYEEKSFDFYLQYLNVIKNDYKVLYNRDIVFKLSSKSYK